MVAAVRGGESMRSVARRLAVGLGTVERWVERAGDERLDRVDWSIRSSAPRRQARQTPALIEDQILTVRRELREESVLGEYGAAAIRRELLGREEWVHWVPSLRTIGRILERRGALDARRRVRRPAPPAGWYLPDVRSGLVELDSFDVIDGLRLKGGAHIDILTGISLHGGLAAAWPEAQITARQTVLALLDHWRAVGLPAYAQFDNDMRFHGTHGYRDSIGPVPRLCLALGVAPVFAPPRETGFQAAIESFNGRWQAKVWSRFFSLTLADLQARSTSYIEASRSRSAVRIEAAPRRTPVPASFESAEQAELGGRMIFLRRTSPAGTATVLGRAYPVDPLWAHRLVRGELDLTGGVLRFYALRRREPTDQPLLREHPYHPVIERVRHRPGGDDTVTESHLG
jgi:hypothetical protein